MDSPTTIKKTKTTVTSGSREEIKKKGLEEDNKKEDFSRGHKLHNLPLIIIGDAASRLADIRHAALYLRRDNASNPPMIHPMLSNRFFYPSSIAVECKEN